VVSCTTGRANYDEWNSREILTEWTDHPQRLWDAIEHTLASGAELVIHVGPEPKLIPAAFERLSGKVMKQLKSRHLDSLGRRVLPSISRNHWLARRLPHNAVVIRAPFVNHLILEDWLLDQEWPEASITIGGQTVPLPEPTAHNGRQVVSPDGEDRAEGMAEESHAEAVE